MKLREYQTQLIDQARSKMRTGCRRLILQAPTGAGKTVLIAHMLRQAESKGKRAWFICHRRELIHQAKLEFVKAGINPGFIAAGMPEMDQPTKIASIQTLNRRINHYKDKPELIIWDEAHHIAAKTWSKIMALCPESYHIGLTATPCRLDGKPLGEHFQEMICGPSVRQLIDLGFLSDYKIYAPPAMDTKGIRKIAGDYDKSELYERFVANRVMADVVAQYVKHAAKRQALCFAAMRKHSDFIAAQFRSMGIIARHVDGETPDKTRDEDVREFEEEVYPILTNCQLFGEGFNVCGIEALLICTATASLSKWLQMIGRALRPHPGKERAIILDFCGNVHRHGLPDEVHEWTLKGRVKHETPRNEFRQCPHCYFIQRTILPRCQECGNSFPVQHRKLPKHEGGELIEFNAEMLRRKRKQEQGMAKTLHDLIELGKRRGYRNPYFWATKILDARRKK